MRNQILNSRPVVAALVLFFAPFASVQGAVAQTATLDSLFSELQEPDLVEWQDVENRILVEWSHSGSEAMDLLLERGRRAIKDGDYVKAVEHLTALVDHAPEFAEGWNARATAFFMMDEFGLSVADIEQTLALNPRHFGAMSGLGMIFEALDQPEKALVAYRAAKAVHPHRPNLDEAIERLEDRTSGTSL
jgi:tetratricopeptide (TPR) repeat protein